jgi:uncharacterized protein with FMN-binding domain
MRRTPIVLGATIAGLVAVLTFHTKSAPLTLGSLPSSSSAKSQSGSSAVAGSAPGDDSSDGTSSASNTSTSKSGTSSTSSTPSSSSTRESGSTTTTLPTTEPSKTTLPSTTTTPSTTPTSATVPATSKSATGESVNYTYGTISVTVTVSGSKITNVGIGSLVDDGDFRSQSIDQQSIPILEQEVIQAQSANIQSVSGASYTSSGFEQSLQSALTKLDF